MISGKRGQVFLMAAVIIVGLIFGASKTLNYVSAGSSQEAFFDLTDEIDFEVKKVMDYGVFSETLVGPIDFLPYYTEYILEEEVVFIYGNLNQLSAIHYDSNNQLEAVTFSVGSSSMVFSVQQTTGTSADITSSISSKKVTVKINEVDYDFDLKDGNNFYFVIIKDDDEEKFVST